MSSLVNNITGSVEPSVGGPLLFCGIRTSVPQGQNCGVALFYNPSVNGSGPKGQPSKKVSH